MRKKFSVTLKYLVAIISFLGVVVACVFAGRDGFSVWPKRLLYFTQQSNIWIGAICLIIAILLTIELKTKKKLVKDYLYVIKFVFTISITITGIIFCSLLGPFAAGEYNAWSFSSLITHVFVPVLSILDFFVDDYKIIFKKWHTLLGLIPPFAYFIFATILSLFNIDFGRGELFPYFFLNIRSPAGFFGYVPAEPYPHLGTFYWLLIILIFILLLSYLYYRLHPQTRKFIKQNKKT